jgi:hypothetical protein
MSLMKDNGNNVLGTYFSTQLRPIEKYICGPKIEIIYGPLFFYFLIQEKR